MDTPDSQILIYQTQDGHTRIETRLVNETVWLSLNQMADLFQRDKSVISRHIRNIFNEGELTRNGVVAKYATTAADGKVAKNYLTAEEIDALNRTPMYMGDWGAKLDDFLRLSGRDILNHAGTITHEEALQKARAEYEAYRSAHLDDSSPVEKHFGEAVRETKLIDSEKHQKRR